MVASFGITDFRLAILMVLMAASSRLNLEENMLSMREEQSSQFGNWTAYNRGSSGAESSQHSTGQHSTGSEDEDIRELVLLSPDEVNRRQRMALSLMEAESVVLDRLGVRPAPPTFTRSEKTAASTTSLLRMQSSAIMACITVEIDLTTITAGTCPGCTVSLGLSAEIVADYCSYCYRWRLEAVLGFSIGFHLFGLHMWIGVSVSGRIDPEEVPCIKAKESLYCEVSDIFLTSEDLDDGLWTSRCHTLNPFTVIMSYLEVQLRGVRKYLAEKVEKSALLTKVGGKALVEKLTLEGAMTQALKAAEKLSEYPSYFVYNQGAKRNNQVGGTDAVEPITWTVQFTKSGTDHILNPGDSISSDLEVCKRRCIEWQQCVAITVSKEGEQKYAGSCVLHGPQTPSLKKSGTRDVHFINRVLSGSLGGDASEFSDEESDQEEETSRTSKAFLAHAEGWLTVRAIRGWIHGSSTPSPYLNIKFMRRGEVIQDWTSSYVMFDPMPVWDEIAGVPVHILHGGDIGIVVKVTDASKLNGKIGGAIIQANLPSITSTMHTGGGPPERCRLPCRRNFVLWQYSGAGDGALSAQHAGKVELEIRWIPRPPLYAAYSLKEGVVTSLWAAYDSFSAKMPRYAAQVMQLVQDPIAERADRIPTDALEGMGLARYQIPRKDTDQLTPKELKAYEKARKAELKKKKVRGFCTDALIDAADSEGGRVINAIRVLRAVESVSGDLGNFSEHAVDIAKKKVTFEDTAGGATEADRADVMFYVELAMSVGNLFVRVLADIHAMFAVYFADNAAWTGDCSALPPSFELLYEDSKTTTTDSFRLGMVMASGMRSVRRSKNAGSAHFLTARRSHPSKRVAKDDRNIKTKSRTTVQDADNPWCKREWVSASPAISRQLEFATRDPPTRSKDQGFTAKGHHKGTVYAQLWCEAAQQWRLAPEFRKGLERRAFLEKTMESNMITDVEDLANTAEAWAQTANVEGAIMGRTMRYESSCRRLQEQTFNNPKTDKLEKHHVWDYRDDCELAHFSPAFLTIFSKLFAQINIHFARIGAHLEEALLCGGQHLPEKARQFKRPSASSEFQRCEFGSLSKQRALVARFHFLAIVHELRTFLIRIGAPLVTKSSEEQMRSSVLQDVAANLAPRNELEEHGTPSAPHTEPAKLELLEPTGAVRYIAQEFAETEANANEAWNDFSSRISNILTKVPWSLSPSQMQDVVSTIAGTDVAEFRGSTFHEEKMNTLLKLTVTNRNPNARDECENLREADTEALLRCWDLQPMELEMSRANAYLARLGALSKYSFVRLFTKLDNCHWALGSYFDLGYACSGALGVWMYGKAKVMIKMLTSNPFKTAGSDFAPEIVSPNSEFRWVRFVKISWFQVELQLIPMLSSEEQWPGEPDWLVEQSACKTDAKTQTCLKLRFDDVPNVEVAHWPEDGRYYTSPEDRRALRIRSDIFEMYLLLAAPPPPDGVVLTIPEQEEAQRHTRDAWEAELKLAPTRTDDKVEKMYAFWTDGLGRSRKRDFKYDRILERVTTYSKDWKRIEERANNALHNKANWSDIMHKINTLATASAIAVGHDQFVQSILQTSQYERAEMSRKIQEPLNAFLATQFIVQTDLTVSEADQITRDEIRDILKRTYTATSREVNFALQYALQAQLRYFTSERRFQTTRRLIIEALLQKRMAESNLRRPDKNNYVVFAGKALIAKSMVGRGNSICCCKLRKIQKRPAGCYGFGGKPWCGNAAAERRHWPKDGSQEACCKRRFKDSCDSVGGYGYTAPTDAMCQPLEVDEQDSNTFTANERSVRLIVTGSEASLVTSPEHDDSRQAHLQFLTGVVRPSDVVGWETSVEACAILGRQKCRSVPLTCLFKFSVQVDRDSRIIGVEDRFSKVKSIIIASDDMRVRLVPLREGGFLPDPPNRGDLELHRKFTYDMWLEWLEAMGSQKEGKECRRPPERDMFITEQQLLELSREQTVAVGIEVSTAIIDKMNVGEKKFPVLAYMAWEARWIGFAASPAPEFLGAGVELASPFDTQSANGASAWHCCSMKPNPSCGMKEELLPLACTVAYTNDRHDFARERVADAESMDLNLGQRGWNLLAAMDSDFHIAFSYWRPPVFDTNDYNRRSLTKKSVRELKQIAQFKGATKESIVATEHHKENYIELILKLQAEPQPLLLTGLLWEALPEVLRDFSAVQQVAARKKALKRHLAFAIRREGIATGKSVKLPYPPIQYESSVAIKLNAGVYVGEWTGVESPCEPPKYWSFGYRHRTLGNSWSEQEASEHCIMGQGVVDKIGITVMIERCWHLTAGSEEESEDESNMPIKRWVEEPEWYDVWRFDIFGVLEERDSLLKVYARNATKYVKNLFKQGWASIVPSDLLEVPDWLNFDEKVGGDGKRLSLVGHLGKYFVVELAKALLFDPKKFLGAAASGVGGMLGAVGGMLAKVASSVMTKVKDAIYEWVSEFMEKTALKKVVSGLKVGWEWIKQHVGFDSKSRQCVRTALTLSRPSHAVSDAPWTKEYELHYMTFTTLEMRITVPGIVKVSVIMAYVTDLNLSVYLTMMIHWMASVELNIRLDQCLSCFACGELQCDKKKGKGRVGGGVMHAYCVDERAVEDKREKPKQNDTVLELANSIQQHPEKGGYDRCLQASNAAAQCGASPVVGGADSNQRLIEIIEDCQSLVPLGAAMN